MAKKNLELLGVSGAAKLLDICEETVHRYADVGKLPLAARPQALKNARIFLREDLVAFLKKREATKMAEEIPQSKKESKNPQRFERPLRVNCL